MYLHGVQGNNCTLYTMLSYVAYFVILRHVMSSNHGYWEQQELKRKETCGQQRTRCFSLVKGKVHPRRGHEGPQGKQR